MKMIGNVSDWLSYAGGALIKVADSAGSAVYSYYFKQLSPYMTFSPFASIYVHRRLMLTVMKIEDFRRVLTIYGHGCNLGHVTWLFMNTLVPPSYRSSL